MRLLPCTQLSAAASVRVRSDTHILSLRRDLT
jgi:hypothetical protein